MKETLVISDPHPIISLIIVCKWVKLIKIGSICYLASGIFHLIKHQKSSAIKDTVAFFKHFISFGTQMKLLSKVTHIEEFFVVLLE